MKDLRLSKVLELPFLLDETKLQRITDIIERYMKEYETPISTDYEIKLKGAQSLKLTSYQDVINNDNTVVNPIESLEINTRAFSREYDIDLSINIKFDGYIYSKGKIDLLVSGSDGKAVHSAFSELLEQIERIVVRSWVYRVKDKLWLAIVFFGLLFLGFSITASYIKPGPNYELARKALKTQSPEDKLNFLFETEIYRSYPKLLEAPVQQGNSLTIHHFVIALPFILIIALFIYILTECYPNVVFLWGDYTEVYKNLVDKRRIIWNIIITVLAAGIIFAMFSNSFTRIFN